MSDDYRFNALAVFGERRTKAVEACGEFMSAAIEFSSEKVEAEFGVFATQTTFDAIFGFFQKYGNIDASNRARPRALLCLLWTSPFLRRGRWEFHR
jgi:hypothetical protein